MQKFTETLFELESAIDKWTFFIKNAEKHAWKPAELKAYEDAKIRIFQK